MPREDTFKLWATGPSKTEQDKADNACSVILETLEGDERLAGLGVGAFVQGSYKAKTNVRLDSDVDICVFLKNSYFYDLQFSDLSEDNEPGSPATISYAEFKNEVERALLRRFSKTEVLRGNKAFDIHANTYRVDADVVPAFLHRRYLKGKNYDGTYIYDEGIAFIPDNGRRIENWPTHTFTNGDNKDRQTYGRYKDVIRVIKVLRNKMQDQGIKAADNIGSFLIEGLVWNTPNSEFNNLLLERDVENVLNYIFINTIDDDNCIEWGEVNEKKYLFRGTAGVREKANSFIFAALKYLNYI